MQFGNPVSHPLSPAVLTLLCWECTRRGNERICAGSVILVLLWSFLLATLYSIWKTRIVSFLVQSLAENRKELNKRERKKERGTEREMRERTQNYTGQFSKTKTGSSSTSYILCLAPPPLLHLWSLQGELFASPKCV